MTSASTGYIGGSLREPLYQVDAARHSKNHKINRSQKYLPPYRYDSNETFENIYQSSEEAYTTVAKGLILEYEASKDYFDPYDVLIRSLEISQIKKLADAHMEKALSLPTFPERCETEEMALIRKVDELFGHVLLEFYASRDGILLKQQIESLKSKNNRYHELTHRNQMSDSVKIRPRSPINAHLNNSFTNSTKEFKENRGLFTRIENSTSTATVSTNVNQYNSCNPYKSQTTFERIYNRDEEDNRNDNDTRDKSFNHISPSVTSKMRREIMSEIVDLKDIMKKASSDSEKRRYKKHLKKLLGELEVYSSTNHYMRDNEIQEPQQSVMERRDSIATTATYETEQETEREKISSKRNIKSSRQVFTFSPDEKMLHQSRGFIHINDVEKGFRIVNVAAHDNLQDGHLFQAQYRSEFFTVRVPSGGVKKGQIFTSPMLHPSGEKENLVKYESLLDRMDIPSGGWRDRIFNCCSDPLLLISFLFPNGK